SAREHPVPHSTKQGRDIRTFFREFPCPRIENLVFYPLKYLFDITVRWDTNKYCSARKPFHISTMHTKTSFALVSLFVALLLPGCDKPQAHLKSLIGESVKVQFRRDALGAAAALPVPPTTDSMNGAATSISGTLVAVEIDSVVVEVDKKSNWIPRDVILSIEATE
ncbi:MAG: hypothetical protein RI957_2177, partial [Verrucomicrobiota bacterium]